MMRTIFGILLITILISCQSKNQEKHISVEKHIRVDQYDFAYQDSLHQLSIQQSKTRDSLNYVKAHKKDTLIIHDYTSIIKSLKRLGKKSRYFTKDIIDTATWLCPPLLKQLLCIYPRAMESQGIEWDNIQKRQTNLSADTFQTKYSDIIDLFNDRNSINKLLTEYNEGEKVTLEHELYVIKYENTLWLYYASGYWSFDYLLILKHNQLIIQTITWTENMPDIGFQ
jgi:hypothetical protein